MKPYPSYKPSGVPWLGDMPAHWESKAAKFLVTCNDDVLTEDVDPATEIVYIEIADVEEGQGIKATTDMLFKDAPSRARRQVKHGDIIVSTVRTYLKAIAAVENPPDNLVVSTGFAVLRPHGITQGFAKYAFAESGFINTVIARSNGVSYPAINATDLVRIPIPVPPATEQQSIADYIDRETARIDMLLAEKGRLIETLREYRQATISEVVTQGLDPAAPKKHSGVPWLGEVPRHWFVKKVKHVASMRSGEGITAEDIEDTGIYPVYGGNGSRGFTGQATHSGEFVLVGRQGALCGNVHYVRGEFWASEHAVVSSFYMGDSPRWAAYMFELMNLGQYSVSAAQPGLAVERILQLPLITPPVSEQQAIAAYLDHETARIDKLVDHVQDEIKLLQELRAATITDAVTGKIQVG